MPQVEVDEQMNVLVQQLKAVRHRAVSEFYAGQDWTQGNHWFHQPAAKWSSLPLAGGSAARATPPGSPAPLRSSLGRGGGK